MLLCLGLDIDVRLCSNVRLQVIGCWSSVKVCVNVYVKVSVIVEVKSNNLRHLRNPRAVNHVSRRYCIFSSLTALSDWIRFCGHKVFVVVRIIVRGKFFFVFVCRVVCFRILPLYLLLKLLLILSFLS